MTKDTKKDVVVDVEKKDVEVVNSKKGKIKTFVKNHYKGIIIGSVAVAATAYVGKEVKNIRDEKRNLLDDEKEGLKISESVESEPTEEGSEE